MSLLLTGLTTFTPFIPLFAIAPPIVALGIGIIAGVVGAAISSAYSQGVKDIFDALVLSNDSIYIAIITPCKMLAGAGFIYSMFPLLKADLHQLKHDGSKILFTFLLVLMFINNGSFGRAIAIGNYAVIVGINRAIGSQLDTVASVNQKLLDIGADKATIADINNKLNECLAIPRQASDGTANPLFTNCNTELNNKINTATYKNAQLRTDMLAAGANPANANLTTLAGDIAKKAGSFISDTSMAIPKAIFDAWKSLVGIFVQLGFALSLTILPIPLALSIGYSAPLQAWFAGLWSLGFFQWALTILSGALLVLTSNLGGSAPLFFNELAISFFAPAIAAGLAAAGAFGVYKVAEQAGQAAAGAATKIISSI